MRGRFYKTITGVAIAASCLYGCSTVPGNAGRVLGNTILLPGKVIRAAGEDLNPVKGLREGVFDLGESVYDLASGKEDARRPDELGVANEYINERAGLQVFVDTAIGAGIGAAIGHASGAGGYGRLTDEAALVGAGIGAGSQLAIESLDYAVDK
jgi:hypothetical protein